MNYRLSIFVLFYLVISFSSGAQKAVENRVQVFEISIKQAEHFLTKQLTLKDSLLFKNSLGLLQISELDNLKPGNYLLAKESEGTIWAEYFPKNGFKLNVLNNNTDLILQLSNNNVIINNAKLSIGGNRLKFDSKIQAYRIRNTNLKGLLKIYYQSQESYFILDNNKNEISTRHNRLNWEQKKIGKYIASPFYIIQKLPKLYKDCTINDECYFWEEVADLKDVQIWDDLYDKYYGEHHEIYKGTIYSNKPKYKPQDTVQLKLVLQYQRNNKYYTHPIDVYFESDKQRHFIKTIYPEKNIVGFDVEFVLHDSLPYKLDHWQNKIRFYKHGANEEPLYEHRLSIESYNLDQYKMNIHIPSFTHEMGKGFTVSFTAENFNNHLVSDFKAKVSITLNRIEDNNAIQELILPLKMWEKEIDIINGKGSINIPDSIFKNVTLKYHINAEVRSPEMEIKTKSQIISYHRSKPYLYWNVTNDSFSIEEKNTNDLSKVAIPIEYFNLRNESISSRIITLPYAAPIEPDVAIVKATFKDSVHTFYLNKQVPELIPVIERKGNSLIFNVHNPYQRPFTFQVYKNKKQIEAGYALAYHKTLLHDQEANYYLVIQFQWADSFHGRFAYARPLRNQVNLDINYPPNVYPGEDITFEIKATDYRNKPVANMNILSYAINSRFYDNDSKINVYQSEGIQSLYHYYFQKYQLNTKKTPTDFSFWNTKLGLDTIPSFQFRFPQNTIYKHAVPSIQSITQAAPFIVKNGAIEPIYYVKKNDKLVYISSVNFPTPYSFEVNDSLLSTNFEIRTRNKLIFIETGVLSKNSKNILSVDVNSNSKNVVIRSMPDSLTIDEQKLLNRHTLRINNTETKISNYDYISDQHNEGIVLLNHFKPDSNYYGISKPNRSYYNDHYISAGPFQHSNLIYNNFEKFSLPFMLENNQYYYSFLNSYLKLKSAQYAPSFTANVPPISDEVINKAFLQKLSSQKLRDAIYTFGIPDYIENLKLQFQNAITKEEILFTLIMNTGIPSDVSIFPGLVSNISFRNNGIYNIYYFKENSEVYCFQDLKGDTAFVKLHPIDWNTAIKIDSLFDFKSMLSGVIDNPYNIESTFKKIKLRNALITSVPNTQFKLMKGILVNEKGAPMRNMEVGIPGLNEKATVTNHFGYFEIPVISNTSTAMFKMIIADTVQTLNIDFTKINYIIYSNDTTAISRYAFGNELISSTNPMRANGYISNGSNESLKEVTVKQNRDLVIDETSIFKSSLVGATSIVNKESYETWSSADITKMIENAAPDIQIENLQTVSGYKLRIRGMGAEGSSPLIVIDGVVYTGDLSLLNPALIQNITILRDVTATSLYGSRGANGVIVMTSKQNIEMPSYIKENMELPELNFNPEELMQSSLRTHFRDDAFWFPKLVTDQNGLATFSAKFPDDITSWDMFTIGRNKQGKIAYSQSNIKSFKPLNTQLSIPNFLIQNDSLRIFGKVQNINKEATNIRLEYRVDDSLMHSKNVKVENHFTDSLVLIASKNDTTLVSYILKREDGYFDGEEKVIKNYPIGSIKSEGAFLSLNQPDTQFMIPSNTYDSLHITVYSSLLDIITDESEKLNNYEYLCNEQMASKIVGLLQLQKIKSFTNQPFDTKQKRSLQKLIDKLSKNKLKNYEWSWWEKEGNAVPWMSTRILEALFQAQQNGYNVPLINDTFYIRRNIEKQLETNIVFATIDNIKLLHLTNTRTNIEPYINYLLTEKKLSLREKIDLMQIQKARNIKHDASLITATLHYDIFGNIYWKDSTNNIHNNDLMATVSALEYILTDTMLAIDKQKIVNWILQQRNVNGFNNTYESGRVVEVLAKCLHINKLSDYSAQLQLNGAITQTVNKFPFQTTIAPQYQITQVHKSGNAPVYFTYYQNVQDTSMQSVDKDFVVHTFLKNRNDNNFVLGKEARLHIEVEVKKEASFVMIEIPIPASCTYTHKNQYYGLENHRSYDYNKVNIFLERLPEGKHTFTVDLMPKYSGSFTLNPAKVTLMYFPTFYGRSEIKRVKVD